MLSIVGRADHGADAQVQLAKRPELGPRSSTTSMIAGHLFYQISLNSANRSSAAASDGAVYTGFRSFATVAQSFEAHLNKFRSR